MKVSNEITLKIRIISLFIIVSLLSIGVNALQTSIVLNPDGRYIDFYGTLNTTEINVSGGITLGGERRATWPSSSGASEAGGWTNTSGETATSLNVSVDSGVLFVDSTGDRVGIGTTLANFKLDVIGTINGSNLIVNDFLNATTLCLDGVCYSTFITLDNLQTNITAANVSMKSYVDARITEENTSMKEYVEKANTSMKGYVDANTITLAALDNGTVIRNHNTSWITANQLETGNTTQEIIDSINMSRVTVNCSNMMFNDGSIGASAICDGSDDGGGSGVGLWVNGSSWTYLNTSYNQNVNISNVLFINQSGLIVGDIGAETQFEIYNSSNRLYFESLYPLYFTKDVIANLNGSWNGSILYPTIVGMQTNITAANVSMKSYVDARITEENTSMKEYVEKANTSMKGYVDANTITLAALDNGTIIRTGKNANLTELNVSGKAIFSNGNVGIGTTSPAAKLQVASGNPIDANISGLLFVNGTRVGIGTTSPESHLHIEYNTNSGEGVSLIIGNEDYNDDTSYTSIELRGRKQGGTGAGGKIVSDRIGAYNEAATSHDADMVFYTANNDIDSEVMRLTYLRNVGIGIPSPNYKLDVNGTINASNLIVNDFVNATIICLNGLCYSYIINLGNLQTNITAANVSMKDYVDKNTVTLTALDNATVMRIHNTSWVNNTIITSFPNLDTDSTDDYTSTDDLVDDCTEANGCTLTADDVVCTDCVDGTDLSDIITLDATMNIKGTSLTDFAINTTDLFINFSSGKIGIGTAFPSHKLNVIGHINITGYGLITNLTASDSVKFKNSTSREVWRTYVNGSNCLITEYVG